MQLCEAIDTYMIVTRAEGSLSEDLNQTGVMLSTFLGFTGDMPVAELDNLHVMLFLSTEWVNAKRDGFRYSLRSFLSRYLRLFRFFRWMELEGLVRLDFYQKWRARLHPEDRPGSSTPDLPDEKNPPESGGFLFCNFDRYFPWTVLDLPLRPPRLRGFFPRSPGFERTGC